MRITIMRHPVLFLSAVLLAGVPAASAQSEQAPVHTDDVKEAKTVAVTGCVTTDADGKTFTVTGTTPTDPAPSTWTLQSERDLELRPFAGKKVEITGTIDSKSGAIEKASTDSTAGTPAAAATSGPRLHVRSVKPIADTCS